MAKIKTEVFYFNGTNGFSNVGRLITDGDYGLNILTFEDGYAKMVDGEEKTITIDFSEFNDAKDINKRELREMALGILKAVDGDNFNIKNTDALMSQIKVRVSTNKTLREFLSSVEICYVEFTDGTCCLIGDPVRQELTTTDTVYLKTHLLNVEDSICYSLEGMGIGTSISKYFQAKIKKEVKGSYIINSVTAFESFKELLKNKLL